MSSPTPATPPVLAVRKAAMLALSVPGISLTVYQADWPPLFVSTSPSTAPPGEVWMTLCPDRLRDALCHPDEEQRRLIGPSLGTLDGDVRIDVIPGGSATIDDAGVFCVDGDDGHSVVGFTASGENAFASSQAGVIDQVLPCGRVVNVAPPDVIEVDPDLDVGVIAWRFPTGDRPRRHAALIAAFETQLRLTVEDVARYSGDGA